MRQPLLYRLPLAAALVLAPTAGWDERRRTSWRPVRSAAPQIALTDRLGLTISVRTLMGSDVGEGTAINRTDIAVGGRLTLF